MPYAKLPWEVPGVTCPLPPSDEQAEAANPDPTPVLLDELPAPPPLPSSHRRTPRARAPGHAEEIPDRSVVDSLLLRGLSSDQREAVVHGEGPLRILAGPGTGKTEVLARRIAYLSRSGAARLQNMLAVTFTVSAADEMRLRLIDLIGLEGAERVTVCTIHSLCAKIIHAHGGGFGRDREHLISDPATVARIARAILADPTGEELRGELRRFGKVPVAEALERISLAKNRLWSIEDYAERSEHQARTVIAALWRELDAQMRAANSFDFDDLLVCTVALLHDDHRLREHYRERYRWMLIDEFQDVNVAQMEIVRLLIAPHGNLTVVGDDDQCLYEFRLAEVENILNFTDDFPQARTVKLSVNRRSRTEILIVATLLIAHNKRRVAKELVACCGHGGFVGERFYRTDEHEASDVADLVETEIAIGRDPGEILVLCRNTRPLRYLRQRLQERGIKVRLLGEQSLWERSEIRDAIAYLALLANPYDAGAYRRAVAAPRDRKPFSQGKVKTPTRGIDKGALGIVKFAREERIDLIDASLRAEEIPEVRANARAQVREFAAAVNRIRRQSWSRGPARPSIGALVDLTLKIAGGPIQTYQYLRDHARNRAVREDANRVLEDLRSLTRSAHSYEQATTEEQPTLAGFLESLGPSDGLEVNAAHDDRVTLSTIHNAKGTETETVIVIGLEEGLLPDHRSSGEPKKLEGERKLAYTAVTRAKVNLLFTHVATRNGAATRGPSRFLGEAGLL